MGYPLRFVLSPSLCKTFLESDRKCVVAGNLVSITVLGQPIIIINSSETAYAMLEKKSSIYSDRPSLIMGGELVGWVKTVVLTQYGDRFRAIRKMMHGVMGTRSALELFAPMIELETHRMMRRILEQPEHVADGIRQTAGAIILRMSHGYTPKEQDDPIVHCVDRATKQFSDATAPGAFLVDVIPARECPTRRSRALALIRVRCDSETHSGMGSWRGLPAQGRGLGRDAPGDGRHPARLGQEANGERPCISISRIAFWPPSCPPRIRASAHPLN